MGVPTHGDDCYTKAWKTKCQYCGQTVFFFQCNHGSKVYFDDHYTGRLHADFCGPYRLLLEREAGRTYDELLNLFGDYTLDANDPIHLRISEMLRRFRAEDNTPQHRDVEPYEGAVNGVFEILEIDKNLNVLRYFGVERSYISEQVFRPLVEMKFIRMRVRQRNSDDNYLDDYEVLIPTATFDKLECRLHGQKGLQLTCEQSPNYRLYWLVVLPE